VREEARDLGRAQTFGGAIALNWKKGLPPDKKHKTF